MRVFLIFVAIALAGCAPQTQYIRADGRYASPQSIEGALAECGSDSKDNLCMVEKGYFDVSAEQAEAKRTQLATIAQADEQAALAKANEQARHAKAKEQAKAKEKQRRAKPAAEASKRAMKQALDEKKRKQTVNNSNTDGSIWSSPPTFMSIAPARR